jgi:nitrite reductase (NADH) large subunit
MGVRRGTLSAAQADGCHSVELLARRTGASTVCGSCRPLLAELVGALHLSHASQRGRWLLTAACLAGALALLIVGAPAIPFADTVQNGNGWDVLWRVTAWKRATGFTLAGIALLSLLFSLRKRVKFPARGEVSSWRALHATLGAATLVALVAHTGFRLGHNLNLVLSVSFLALALAGALAAGVTALENRFPGPASRRLRAAWTAVHIALVWPLPVLVVFHALASYYF